jgi:hypothetical protein
MPHHGTLRNYSFPDAAEDVHVVQYRDSDYERFGKRRDT